MIDWEEIFETYLSNSYKYYKNTGDDVTWSNTEYDYWCRKLLESWDYWEHEYKYLITKDDLKAGTGFMINYPQELIDAFSV